MPDIHHSRVCGAVMASAAGDALGAPYEFDPAAQYALGATNAPLDLEESHEWKRGEWTDDTAMAVPILEAFASGMDLEQDDALAHLVRRWITWARESAKGIGQQTAQVFIALQADVSAGDMIAFENKERDAAVVAAAHAAAKNVHDKHSKSAGNGCLMRIAPLAARYMVPPDKLAHMARAQAKLTHYEQDGPDACVLWALAMQHAVRTGALDVRAGMEYIPADRRQLWEDRIRAAETEQPPSTKSGWVVAAFQCAWAAVRIGAAAPPGGNVRAALEAAVRMGGDTDTVAAITGALIGAAYGVEQLPQDWRLALHGWPADGMAYSLERLVEQILNRGTTAVESGASS